MHETFALAMVWFCISVIWILYLYNVISSIKESAVDYLDYHQKFITLYIKVSCQNRKLIKQNQQYKHAIADCIFHPQALTLTECDAWFKRYDIDPKFVQELESSQEENDHFTISDRHATRFSKAVLSKGV